jgi:autotransporter-associated beta strand protein
MTLTGIGGNATVDTQNYEVGLHTLSGPGGLTKTGAGTLLLYDANSYLGPTTVVAGTVKLGPAAQNTVLSLGGADIQAGKILFDYSGGTNPAATILDLLSDSYDGGLWDIGQFRNSTAGTTGGTLGW